MPKKIRNTNAPKNFEMKNRKTIYWALIVLLNLGSIQGQNTKSAFLQTIDSINAIIKANTLAYFTDNQQNSAFIKKISANEQGIIMFTDSIPKLESTTNNAKQKLQPDCCPPKRIRTLDLLAVKKWEIYFPNAYLKDKNNQTLARIIGLRKEDLFKLKEQFYILTTLTRNSNN